MATVNGRGGTSRSAEGREVEVDGNLVAFGRIDIDGGGIGGEVFGGEFKLEGGAGERATTTILRTDVVRLARRTERLECFVANEDLDIEIFPKVVGTRGETNWRTRARARRARNVGGIGIRQKDLDDDFYGFLLAAVIECGLLGAVAGALFTGELGNEGERRKQSDGRDVGAGLGRRENPGVLVEETSKGFIAPLAEEVGFANGLVGQGSVKGEGRRREQQD